MHRRHAEMLSRAAVGGDDLQAVGVTLRRLERFWIRAADLVQRPQPLAPGSSWPPQPRGGPMRIGLFIPCYIDAFFAEVGTATQPWTRSGAEFSWKMMAGEVISGPEACRR